MDPKMHGKFYRIIPGCMPVISVLVTGWAEALREMPGACLRLVVRDAGSPGEMPRRRTTRPTQAMLATDCRPRLAGSARINPDQSGQVRPCYALGLRGVQKRPHANSVIKTVQNLAYITS
jgi:hypothetical protein